MHIDYLLSDIGLDCPNNISISGLSLDSRTLQAGDLFCAYPGTHADGRAFMQQAAEGGAAAIAYDPKGMTPDLPKTCPCIAVPDLQRHISTIAHRYADYPSESLCLIGITGTNGKTSVSYYLAQLLNRLNHPCAIIGTLGAGMIDQLTTTGMTTPNPIAVVKQLTHCADLGATHIAMEVSSHALHQYRTAGLVMPIGVFTNLTQDHLDYHGTMEDYAAAKAMLWQQPGMDTAIINWDDPSGQQWIKTGVPVANVIAYSCHPNASISCDAVQWMGGKIIATPWGMLHYTHHLVGDFNRANVLAVIAVLGSLGFAIEQIESVLRYLKAVPGRMECLHTKKGVRVVIDYAHTPDALTKVLETLRPSTDKAMWCVFGCGGERDTSKRAIMGNIASTLSDHVIITNDNPRHENPSRIAKAIFSGTSGNAETILDREAAIHHTLNKASPGDTVLIAGKGHESTQIVGDTVMGFSDKRVVLETR